MLTNYDIKNALSNRYTETQLKKLMEYNALYPEVYVEFDRRSEFAIKTKRRKYSAQTIIESMRWDYYVANIFDNCVEYKINNNYVAMFTRIIMYKKPKFKTFFEIRGG